MSTEKSWSGKVTEIVWRVHYVAQDGRLRQARTLAKPTKSEAILLLVGGDGHALSFIESRYSAQREPGTWHYLTDVEP